MYTLNSELTEECNFTRGMFDKLVMVWQNRFKVTRDKLGIVPQIQGIVWGDVSWEDGGQEVNASQQGGVKLPLYCPATVKTKPGMSGVVVVEKNVNLNQIGFATSHTFKQMILVETSGFPSYSARRFFACLGAHGLPIYHLTDCEPYRLGMFLACKYGTYFFP